MNTTFWEKIQQGDEEARAAHRHQDHCAPEHLPLGAGAPAVPSLVSLH